MIYFLNMDIMRGEFQGDTVKMVETMSVEYDNTVKPVCNDHLYNEI